MAQISIAILDDGRENVARVLVDDSPTANDHYKGMGVGESSVAANATQHELQGADTKYKDVAGTYQGGHKVRWQTTFGYEDLANHTLRELVVCQDKDNFLNKSLLRATYDVIVLSVGQAVIVTVEVVVS